MELIFETMPHAMYTKLMPVASFPRRRNGLEQCMDAKSNSEYIGQVHVTVLPVENGAFLCSEI